MNCDNVFLSLPPFSTGVIAVVIFIIFSIVGIMMRFLYRHKQTHRTNQIKEKEYPANLDSSFRNDIDLQNTVSECKREYFIWKSTGSTNTLLLLIFSPPLSLSLNSGPFLFLICSPFIFGSYLHQPWHLPLTQPRRPGSYGHCLPLWQTYCDGNDHSRLTWLLDKEEICVHMCIFSSAFISQMHLRFAAIRPAGLLWTWGWLSYYQPSLSSSLYQVCSDQGTEGRKEDARGLASFSAILKGTREDCFVLISVS